MGVLVAMALCLAAPAVLSAKPPKPPRTGSGSAQVDKPCDGLPDPIGVVTDGCNAIADAVPDVPSPKEIAELPTKAASDVLNGIKNDIVSTMAAGVAKAASWLLGKTLDAITGSTTPDVGRDVDPGHWLPVHLSASDRPVEEVLERAGQCAGVFGGAEHDRVRVANRPPQLLHRRGEALAVVVGIEVRQTRHFFKQRRLHTSGGGQSLKGFERRPVRRSFPGAAGDEEQTLHVRS
jgi:hypothetical protein